MVDIAVQNVTYIELYVSILHAFVVMAISAILIHVPIINKVFK